MLSKRFSHEYELASKARSIGKDPSPYVEIKPAPDLASRVDGLIGVKGIEGIIRKLAGQKSRSKLAFEVVKEICSSDEFGSMEPIKRMELAVKVGSAILTEGILVAPTEGIQGIREYKNRDGSNYISVLYAGPIRGAGGTAAALSVALADYARRLFSVGAYKATPEEIERYLEEVSTYHARIARLQYKPSEEDLRVILQNLPVCVDGVPTEVMEIGVHRDIKRIRSDGKEVIITNKIRGGVGLVLCEGIAQKAKKLMKEVKGYGLGWDWLSNIIKVEAKKSVSESDTAVFLEELVAGRPILAYPGHMGGFRLRYGRSRMTGIAAKGFSPATMILTMGFVATGTQLKVEMPGKGCVASPVDSIEGPFVRLKSGEALRINDAETAEKLKDEIDEIIYLGDILVTYGDFRKSNTPLQPSSYVEEFWERQLESKGDPSIKPASMHFLDIYKICVDKSLPMHPKYLYEFQALKCEQLASLAGTLFEAAGLERTLSDTDSLILPNAQQTKRGLELLSVPHSLTERGEIKISGDYAQALLVSLGIFRSPDAKAVKPPLDAALASNPTDSIAMVNSLSGIKIMKRSTFIGARIGRPEKAKERMMKPAANALFPIGYNGGNDRNITSSYLAASKRFSGYIKVQIARYRCPVCGRMTSWPYCNDCKNASVIIRKCISCGYETSAEKCSKCSSPTSGYDEREVNIVKEVEDTMAELKLTKMPQMVKGVKGLMSRDRCAEPIAKGVLRAKNGVFTFKDGTARFDSTDMPLTHFYPVEIGTSIEKLREMGYTTDCYGEPLTDPSQLVEIKHQDIVVSRKCGDYMVKVSRFIDDMLELFYGMDRYYNAYTRNDLVGALAITLSPHTSCGVLNRIIGYTDANVGFAHPYIISARRRNCDGDEDTVMLLMDSLINFSRSYLPSNIGGTMDTPLILSVNIYPEEVDDEVHAMETVRTYPLEFYEKSMSYPPPSEVKLEMVESRLGKEERFSNIWFTHGSSSDAVSSSPKRSSYTLLKTMKEKVDAEFELMDKINAVNKRDAAKRVIIGHFIPDLIGNLHSFSRQEFRCSTCNSKYRRTPLGGKCPKDGSKLLLTISRGGIEKYLEMSIALAEKYDIDPYIKQRLYMIKDEIYNVFIFTDQPAPDAKNGQFNLAKFM